MHRNLRLLSIVLFTLLGIGSVLIIPKVKFSFDFAQFFPENDADLDHFKAFKQQFEADDNFMLVAVRRAEGVFDSIFLAQFNDFSIQARQLPHVTMAQSLTTFQYPLKTPFSFTLIPAVHLQNPDRYAADRERIMNDPMLVGNLISQDATTLLLILKNTDDIQQAEAEAFIASLNALVAKYPFSEVHYLGRPNFQAQLVAMQKREIVISTLISVVLVLCIMTLIFRKFWGVFVSMASIGLGALLFVGALIAAGREFNALSALYPVLIIIVGTSDVIHIMTKYVDELRRGNPKLKAIETTIREIGLATFLTSFTTAIGFASLVTSKVPPIRDFGINSAAGVMIAYVTVLFFTTALVSLFDADKIARVGKMDFGFDKQVQRIYRFSINRPLWVRNATFATLLICGIGIARITTNYRISESLPRGAKITADFKFFEKTFGGFRPFEVAVTAKGDLYADDYAVLKQVNAFEEKMRTYPSLQNVLSLTAIYKTMNRAFEGNRPDAFHFPDDAPTFNQYQKWMSRLPPATTSVLLSNDRKATRITAKVLDIGADSIKIIVNELNQWAAQHTDSAQVDFRETGIGVIIDKNAEYIRDSLLKGLLLSVGIVGIVMYFLFLDWKIALISLIPNIIPLFVAGAIIGFAGIELEAGVSIVFTIIFGIAVDDTIHFLSRYKLLRREGKDVETAIETTFAETGKAMIWTTIVLFFGFLVLLFSANPPTIIIGSLISATLFSALICDLYLLPYLLRVFIKDAPSSSVVAN